MEFGELLLKVKSTLPKDYLKIVSLKILIGVLWSSKLKKCCKKISIFYCYINVYFFISVQTCKSFS